MNSVRNDKEFIENIKRIRAGQVGDNIEQMAPMAAPKLPTLFSKISDKTIMASQSAMKKAK